MAASTLLMKAPTCPAADLVLPFSREAWSAWSDALSELARLGERSSEALGRERVVVELAREIDRMQLRDRARVERYLASSARYLEEFRRMRVDEMPLPDAHRETCALAERWLPIVPAGLEDDDADAQ